MFANPRSPFGLRGLPDARTLAWILKFIGAARTARSEAAGPLLRDLNLASRAAYERLVQGLGPGVGYARNGLLMLCQTQAALDGEKNLVNRANQLGLASKVLTKCDILALEPNLTVNTIGGALFEDDAHLSPPALMAGLRAALVQRGVAFQTAAVDGFETSTGRIRAALAGGQRFESGQFIFTAGAWTGRLARKLGVNLPMLSGKGYGVTVANPPEAISRAAILAEARVAVTPMPDGIRFVGTLELGHPSNSVNPSRVDGFLSSVPNYFPNFPKPAAQEVWVGNRPCTPDGLPYLGRLQNWPNAVVATGHAMMGMSLGPITGDLVAEILAGQPPSIPLDLLAPERFA
jgi:D-amino-acid dehydrogenase